MNAILSQSRTMRTRQTLQRHGDRRFRPIVLHADPFVGFAIFVMSVVFCGIGCRRAHTEGRSGKGLAIAGIVIKFVTLLLAVLIVVAMLSA